MTSWKYNVFYSSIWFLENEFSKSTADIFSWRISWMVYRMGNMLPHTSIVMHHSRSQYFLYRYVYVAKTSNTDLVWLKNGQVNRICVERTCIKYESRNIFNKNNKGTMKRAASSAKMEMNVINAFLCINLHYPVFVKTMQWKTHFSAIKLLL